MRIPEAPRQIGLVSPASGSVHILYYEGPVEISDTVKLKSISGKRKKTRVFRHRSKLGGTGSTLLISPYVQVSPGSSETLFSVVLDGATVIRQQPINGYPNDGYVKGLIWTEHKTAFEKLYHCRSRDIDYSLRLPFLADGALVEVYLYRASREPLTVEVGFRAARYGLKPQLRKAK